MSNLDIIREKLDGGQFTDLEELASGLLAALEGVERLADKAMGESPYLLPGGYPSKPVESRTILHRIAYWTDEFAELPKTCAYETYAATLETPAEGCEEDAIEDSEYCKEHGA